MIDVVNGEIRVRAWPKKRPTPANQKVADNNAKFAAVQRVWAYLAPGIQLWLYKQTEGSPLLPRDILTAMLYDRLFAFVNTDGKRVYPVTFRKDISEALDTITQTEGKFLIRGAEGWEASDGGGAGQWSLHHDQTIAAPTANLIISELNQFSEILLLTESLTASTSGTRRLVISTDVGVSYHTGGNDYKQVPAGPLAPFPYWRLGVSSSSTALSAMKAISNQAPGLITTMNADAVEPAAIFEASADKITDLKLFNGAGNLTGGRVRLWGKV